MNFLSIEAIATSVVFLLFATSITIYDVYIIKKKGRFHTISGFIIRSSKKFPVFTFLFGFIFGFLGGHLFWPMDTFDYEESAKLAERCEKFLATRNKIQK